MRFQLGFFGVNSRKHNERLSRVQELALSCERRCGALEVQIQKLGANKTERPAAVAVPLRAIRPIGELVAPATILGLVLYSIAWINVRNFYSRFTVKPEEVGIAYASLLSRVASVLGLLAIFYYTASTFLLSLRRLLQKPTLAISIKKVRILLTLAPAVGLGISLYLYGKLSPGTLSPPAIGISISLLVLIVALLWLPPLPWPIQSDSSAFRVVLSFFGFALLFLSTVPFGVIVKRTADDVYYDRRTEASYATELLLGINFRYVSVTWTQEKAPPGFPSNRVMAYLGKSEDTVILYDSLKKTVYRVSSQNVLLTSASEGES
jgi:hypothetical protein